MTLDQEKKGRQEEEKEEGKGRRRLPIHHPRGLATTSDAPQECARTQKRFWTNVWRCCFVSLVHCDIASWHASTKAANTAQRIRTTYFHLPRGKYLRVSHKVSALWWVRVSFPHTHTPRPLSLFVREKCYLYGREGNARINADVNLVKTSCFHVLEVLFVNYNVKILAGYFRISHNIKVDKRKKLKDHFFKIMENIMTSYISMRLCLNHNTKDSVINWKLSRGWWCTVNPSTQE